MALWRRCSFLLAAVAAQKSHVVTVETVDPTARRFPIGVVAVVICVKRFDAKTLYTQRSRATVGSTIAKGLARRHFPVRERG